MRREGRKEGRGGREGRGEEGRGGERRAGEGRDRRGGEGRAEERPFPFLKGRWVGVETVNISVRQ